MADDQHDRVISDLFEGSVLSAFVVHNADLPELHEVAAFLHDKEPSPATGPVPSVPVRNPAGDLGRNGPTRQTEG